MKWFKHMSNMRNHPVVKSARVRFGNEAYAFWNLLLELVSESCGNEPENPVVFDAKFLKTELRISSKKMTELLQFFAENSLISWENFGEKIQIGIPKLASIKDNHSKNLQVTCKSLAPKKKEEREEEKKRSPLCPPKGGTSRARRLPDDWEPSEELLTWALGKYPTVDTRQQTELFKNHFLANGKTMLTWDRAWMNWIARVKQFERPNSVTQANRGTQIKAEIVERVGGTSLF